PYAASKIASDQMALAFHRSFGTPVLVLRPFNTFGPRQSARAVIPTIVVQIANGARKIRLGSLEPTRDFCFVADTVRAFLDAVDAEGRIGDVINPGSGCEMSIGEVLQLIAELMQVEVTSVRDEARLRPATSEVERLYAGIAKANAALGWTPRYAGRDGFA